MFASRYRLIYILLLSVYSYLNIKFTEGDQLISGKPSEIILFVTISALVFLIWEGNNWVQVLVGQKFETKSIFYPLIIGFVSSIIWIVILSFSVVWVQSLFGLSTTSLSLKLALGFTFRVNLFLHCLNVIVTYHSRLRETKIAFEVAQKEGMNARYAALRRQINPHFLFNSLNVLDGLIKINPEDASLFLQRLSEVYRYLTVQEERDIITLEEELTFIKSYIYLLEVRFKNALVVKVDINEEIQKLHIVPSSLQMALENATKHNEVSKSKPLTIHITTDENYLIIKNKIQQKSSSSAPSGTGLENIRLRYEFLGNTIPEIRNDNVTFQLKLPLIKL